MNNHNLLFLDIVTVRYINTDTEINSILLDYGFKEKLYESQVSYNYYCIINLNEWSIKFTDYVNLNKTVVIHNIDEFINCIRSNYIKFKINLLLNGH